MKFLLLILMLSTVVKSFSQTKVNLKTFDNCKYSAEDSIVTDDRNKILALYGNAIFQTEQLGVKADKVVFNQVSREVMVTGLREITYVKKVRYKKGLAKGMLRYKLGDDTVFIN
ncbi:MAG: hypothetical protein EOP41_03815 [Sphingobacteriaceae bacterium]|nr:MAG: hypothetical protein EOP41_03815 [Sphingobacteriaceae bacterium]